MKMSKNLPLELQVPCMLKPNFCFHPLKNLFGPQLAMEHCFLLGLSIQINMPSIVAMQQSNPVALLSLNSCAIFFVVYGMLEKQYSTIGTGELRQLSTTINGKLLSGCLHGQEPDPKD